MGILLPDWSLIKWSLLGALVVSIVLPFYLYAALYEFRLEGPLEPLVGPVLGPGLFLRDRLAGEVQQDLLPKDLLGHAITVLGSAGFWLGIVAIGRLGFRCLLGKKDGPSIWRGAAFTALVAMALLYGFTTMVHPIKEGPFSRAIPFLFAPGRLLDEMISARARGHAEGGWSHVIVVGGSWVAWVLAAMLLRRMALMLLPSRQEHEED